MKAKEYKLRYYQEDAIKATFRYINGGGKAGLVVVGTGLGKSIIIADMAKRILMKKPNVRIMMLTHVKELIEQNMKELRGIWPNAPAGIYSAGIGLRQYRFPITFAGIQSAYKKPQIFGHIDLILIDEAQLVSENAETMYGVMITELRKKNPNLVVIGLTATPYRMKLGLLIDGPIFDDTIYDCTQLDDFVRMIDDGFLSDVISVRTKTEMNLDDIKVIAGEFSEKSLDENLNRDEITKAIVEETINRTQGRNKGLAFCVSVSHAENMAMRFNERGLKADFIHSGLTKERRADTLARFKSGEVKILTNVNVLTVGYNSPDIDYLVLARPTQSTGLHVQMVGRGLRVHPSKTNTLVLDFAGNTIRLGPINDPVLPVKRGEAKGDAPIRVCPECDSICHAALKCCPVCGFEFPPPKVKIDVIMSGADIIKRKDVPDIVELPVTCIIVNKHRSAKGNDTIKIGFCTDEEGVLDQYFMFDKAKKAVYQESVTKAKKLKYDVIIPEFTNTEQAFLFMKNHALQPTTVTVWKNKPMPGGKRRKEIIAYSYEEKVE